jgi:hypothetical protein
MKKYFVLALALIAFAVAPVMADVAISGEFDYSGVWNAGDKEYAGEVDKMEFDVKAAVDEFNTLKFELEDDQADGIDDNIRDQPLTLNYVHLITDWGKYFGIEGFGIMSTVGIDDFGYKETVDFTGYELEYSDSAWLGGAPSVVLDFDIMGIVKPYYAMHMDTFGEGTTSSSNGAAWIMGAVVDVAPVTAEVYFMSNGDLTTVDGKQELNKMFGLEALYSGEVADGVELTAGASMYMQYTEYDEYDTMYGAAVGVGAYGATLNLGVKGGFLGSDAADAADDPSYALSMFSVDGSYDILDWLGVNAGMLFALGDYADYLTDSGETFLGAEFGVTVMPGKVKYGMGYIVTSEDAEGEYWSVMAEDIPANGGLYFIAQVNY